MRPAQLSLAAAAILAVGDAAYNCEVCIDPALPPSPPSATAAFCPENDWYVCLDDAEGRTWAAADATAQRHYIDTLAQITNTTNTDAAAGIGTPCEDALHAWICATHLPVCEASTHGRGVCDTEFTAVTQPACAKLQWQDANESSLGARLTRELASVGRNADKGTVVSDDRGSCFRLDYAGPNYWNWIIGFALCMVFAAMSPLALNLQKSSIMRNDALPLGQFLRGQTSAATPLGQHELTLPVSGVVKRRNVQIRKLARIPDVEPFVPDELREKIMAAIVVRARRDVRRAYPEVGAVRFRPMRQDGR